MNGCRLPCNALWLVRGGRGGYPPIFFFWGFLIWGRFAGWPQSSQCGRMRGVWVSGCVGGQVVGGASTWTLTGFLPLYVVQVQSCSPLVWMQRRELIYCSPLSPKPLPRIGFSSGGDEGRSESCTATVPVPVRKNTHTVINLTLLLVLNSCYTTKWCSNCWLFFPKMIIVWTKKENKQWTPESGDILRFCTFFSQPTVFNWKMFNLQFNRIDKRSRSSDGTICNLFEK